MQSDHTSRVISTIRTSRTVTGEEVLTAIAIGNGKRIRVRGPGIRMDLHPTAALRLASSLVDAIGIGDAMRAGEDYPGMEIPA